MPKKNLTDRALKALNPAAAGQRYVVMDAVVPGFGVRVTDKGQRTFVLVARYPGAKSSARRAIGDYGAVTLEAAREKARGWIEFLQAGTDPKVVEEQQRLAAERARENSFAAVAEEFIKEKVLGPKCYEEWKALKWEKPPTREQPLERKGLEVAREVRREFLPIWGRRPIAEITRRDIRDLIKAKGRTAPAQARNLLVTVKRMFTWAVDEDCYGLTASPADTLKPSKIIGEKARRDRTLDDAELFALWRATERTAYPHGPVYQLLILSGLRLNEAAKGSRPEFDFRSGLWIIPAKRMKKTKGGARAHGVPLTKEIRGLLEGLPRFNSGDYLFSTTFGEKPVSMSDKVKKRIDERMLRTLRALARRRGDDAAKVTLPHWVNHDIRRTVRSGLSALRVPEEVREAVLAHARPGIKGVYDHHDYLEEKRGALDLWAARVRGIVRPPPLNVVQLDAARAS